MCGSKMFLLVVVFAFSPPRVNEFPGAHFLSGAWQGHWGLEGRRSLLSDSLCVLKDHERFVHMTLLIWNYFYWQWNAEWFMRCYLESFGLKQIGQNSSSLTLLIRPGSRQFLFFGLLCLQFKNSSMFYRHKQGMLLHGFLKPLWNHHGLPATH